MDEVNIPHSTMLLGKGVLDESHPYFTGTYSGAASDSRVKQWIENADVVISVGVRFFDTITAGFSQNIPTEKCIDIQPFEARVGQQTFAQIPMREAVKGLHQLTLSLVKLWQPPVVQHPALPEANSFGLGQVVFWQQMQGFLQPGDIVIADQGTACFGAAALTLPKGCQFIVQSLWGSIGYTLPAAFGAQTAEPSRRVILIIGDGAAQLTMQELGSMLRDGLRPIIFLLNNEGYTIERVIHGENQRYNDIAQWNWGLLPQALAGKHQVKILRASKPDELRQALQEVGNSPQLAFVEVVLPKMDFPELLGLLSRALHSRNAAA
jgi:indolepyruvate decarboxylase